MLYLTLYGLTGLDNSLRVHRSALCELGSLTRQKVVAPHSLNELE